MIVENQLEFLSQLGRAIAGQFGPDCEVVIHRVDQGNIDHTIILIENGQVSEREIADGPSEIVLESLKKDPAELQDRINYTTHTRDGRVLKSSTIYLKDDQQLHAILSINYDISHLMMAESTLRHFTEAQAPEKSDVPITQNVNQLLDELLEESVKLVGKPVALMTKADKIRGIHFLNDQGAFLVTKSGDKVSTYYDISKYTLYSYIDAK
ncbi:helix-turn-helix transcriptional regulator [Loigolactobacillus jiayinensis]|uniref:Transcriptional regulator n=1 Tax=Loigolactobacillus jiayinensis TaxID=2486016 RepID=A0ABW1RJ81_9LACO|nr:helix-turn-helix transcriptional regulator [Loigolactobacillus jiayinensis]